MKFSDPEALRLKMVELAVLQLPDLHDDLVAVLTDVESELENVFGLSAWRKAKEMDLVTLLFSVEHVVHRNIKKRGL